MKLYENFINDGTLTNFYGGKTDSGYKLQINGEEKMKDKELTAVEYLVEQLFPKALSEEQYYHIEQAKEMEKEYIKKGWLQDRDITFGDWQQEFEQWLNNYFDNMNKADKE